MIYVDKMRKHQSGMWCHMMTDGALEELHDFAEKIGVKRYRYHKKSSPHYDLREHQRIEAIKNGAVEADNRKIVELIRLWKVK